MMVGYSREIKYMWVLLPSRVAESSGTEADTSTHTHFTLNDKPHLLFHTSTPEFASISEISLSRISRHVCMSVTKQMNVLVIEFTTHTFAGLRAGVEELS
jgi:hypothetical protein